MKRFLKIAAGTLIQVLVAHYVQRRFGRVALDILELAKNEATQTVEYEGFSFDVTYRPNVVTQAWQKKLGKLQQEIQKLTSSDDDSAEEKLEEKTGELTNQFQNLIVGWDLEAGGEKIPVTSDGLDLLPLGLLQHIMTSIIQSAMGSDEGSEAKKGK